MFFKDGPFMKIKLFLALLGLGFLPFFSSLLEARISATVDYLCFPGENGSGRLVLLFGIEGKSMVWTKSQNGLLSGRASFAVGINDSSRNFFAERLDFNLPELRDSSAMDRTFSAWKVIDLPAGSFNVEMLVFDAFSSDTSKERISFQFRLEDAREKEVFSDFLFLDPAFFKASEPIFSQKADAVRMSDFYSKQDTMLRFYAEAHGLLRRFPEGSPLVSRIRILDQESKTSLDDFGKISRTKSSGRMVWVTDLSLKNLPSGNYTLSWDLIDTAGKFIARASRNFKRSNPGLNTVFSKPGIAGLAPELLGELQAIPVEDCRHLVASLFPISRSSEQPSIDYLRKKGTEIELRNFLVDFWDKKSGTNGLRDFRAFKKTVAEADRKYSTQTMKGYQTERGRVYIQYGKPDMVENEQSDRFRKAMTNLNTIPYEIWYYYSLDEPIRQTDVMFVFVQQNRGNINYKLLHSSGIGEVRNSEWRKVVESNATYNFDRMNPDDRGEIGNPKQAR
jgi:GWxTD domain-containing protein